MTDNINDRACGIINHLEGLDFGDRLSCLMGALIAEIAMQTETGEALVQCVADSLPAQYIELVAIRKYAGLSATDHSLH